MSAPRSPDPKATPITLVIALGLWEAQGGQQEQAQHVFLELQLLLEGWQGLKAHHGKQQGFPLYIGYIEIQSFFFR